MADVVVGNVILTSTLVAALIIFVAAAQAYSTFYQTEEAGLIMEHYANYVSQAIQETYIVLNSSNVPASDTRVEVSLNLPLTIINHAYTLDAGCRTQLGHENLTIVFQIRGSPIIKSSSTLVGLNTICEFPATQVCGTPNLTLSALKAADGKVIIGFSHYVVCE